MPLANKNSGVKKNKDKKSIKLIMPIKINEELMNDIYSFINYSNNILKSN